MQALAVMGAFVFFGLGWAWLAEAAAGGARAAEANAAATWAPLDPAAVGSYRAPLDEYAHYDPRQVPGR